MPRPCKCRFVTATPAVALFKPAGVPARQLEVVELRLDEFEALRLADHEQLYQESAADQMGISRPTFARLIASARYKVADVLLNGKALVICGGNIMVDSKRAFECADCGHRFEVAFGTGRPTECPSCQSHDFRRAVEVESAGGGRGRCRGRGGLGAGRGQCRRRRGASESTAARPAPLTTEGPA